MAKQEQEDDEGEEPGIDPEADEEGDEDHLTLRELMERQMARFPGGTQQPREDLQQERRLGLIAQEVEEALGELAIDNVTGTKWHLGEGRNTPQYDRLVPLLVNAANRLSQQVKDLQ